MSIQNSAVTIRKLVDARLRVGKLPKAVLNLPNWSDVADQLFTSPEMRRGNEALLQWRGRRHSSSIWFQRVVLDRRASRSSWRPCILRRYRPHATAFKAIRRSGD